MITDAELDILKTWSKLDDPMGWFQIAIDKWDGIPWGKKEEFTFDGHKTELKCVTSGMADNECIISAMQANRHMWSLYWYQSTRGGRYTFAIDDCVSLR
jgi:hypothetical protein